MKKIQIKKCCKASLAVAARCTSSWMHEHDNDSQYEYLQHYWHHLAVGVGVGLRTTLQTLYVGNFNETPLLRIETFSHTTFPKFKQNLCKQNMSSKFVHKNTNKKLFA